MTIAVHQYTTPSHKPGHARPLAVCYGTRPQVIKASVLVQELSSRWPLITVDTGQHYDYELNALLYEQLGVRRPDVLLGVGSGTHADQTSAILLGAARVFEEHAPWAVVVIGDTNSTVGCALAAVKMRIPVLHVEAGLRAADVMMAEEINRRVVDAISSVLCAPSRRAEVRLRSEHVGGRVLCTGDVARDVLVRQAGRLPPAHTVAEWPLARGAAFAFATLHRAELTADPAVLGSVLHAFDQLSVPVVLALHPRTKSVIEKLGLSGAARRNLHLRPPLGYLETLACVRDASVVLTDSGGVQREAYWLGTPCVTLRAETEWIETVECGANILLPGSSAPERLPDLVAELLAKDDRTTWDRDAYGRGDAAREIAAALEVLAATGVVPA